MLIALCAGSFKQEVQEGKITVYDIYDIAVRYGFDGLEIREDLLENKPSDLPYLKSLAADSGIGLIYAYMNWPVDKDLVTMKRNVPCILQHLDEAVILGAKVMKTGFGPVDDLYELTEAHFEVLKEIAAGAKAREVILCLENSDKTSGSNAAVIRDIVTKVNSPFFKITYDGGNFAIVGKDPVQALKTMAENVSYVHLKDVKKGEMVNTYMGNGDVDYPSIFGILQTCGYSGYGCFEFSMNTGRMNEIEKSFEYVRKADGYDSCKCYR
jgi:sugar phosphate isomerase/epimerase